MNKAASFMKKYAFRLGILLFIFLLLFAFLGKNLALVIFSVIFIALGAVSLLYYNFFRGPIYFELIKFSTIITTVKFGLGIGLMVGFLSTLIGRSLSGRLDHLTLISFFATAVVAIAASIFSTTNIIFLGIALVILYHLIIFPLVLMIGGGSIGYGIIYSGSNILFNIIIFVYLAPIVVTIIPSL